MPAERTTMRQVRDLRLKFVGGVPSRELLIFARCARRIALAAGANGGVRDARASPCIERPSRSALRRLVMHHGRD